VRIFLVATVLLATLALPASGASVDPSKLVLRQVDVPAGFQLERRGVLTNAEESAGAPRLAAFFRRTGRLTGFEAVFETKEGGPLGPSIESRADVFERASGARTHLGYIDGEMKLSGILRLKRSTVDIGTEGWVYAGRGTGSGSYTLVAWRHGRVFGGLLSLDLSRARTLTLARAQQRRIAASL
jgi:hypothetical protein